MMCMLCFSCAFVMPANAENSYGIDADDPRADAEDVIEYSGNEETYEVKVTGIYDVSVYGAQGGTGIGCAWNEHLSYVSPNKSGDYGSAAKSRIFLEAGTKLTVAVGGQGGTGHLGYRSDKELWGGPGGWPDGKRGNTLGLYHDSDKDKDVAISTGGGGGSSCISYDGEMIISAAGGSGGAMMLDTSRNRNQRRDGGAGGGSSFIKDAGDLTWMTDDVNVLESGQNGGNGKIVFTLVRPRVGGSIHADREDWTTEDVTLRVSITSTGDGLPEECLYWEYDPKSGADDAKAEGAPLGEWTDEDTLTVSANGTVTCSVRDINGNESTATFHVTNIDRKGPKISRELSPSEWTMDPVTLTIRASDEDGVGIADEGYLWSDDAVLAPDDEGDYELLWNATTSKTYDENTSVTVTVRDKLGNRTEQTIEITNIDRTAPTVKLTPEDKWTSGEMTFMIDAEDLQPDGKTPGCGLPEDAYSADGTTFTDERAILVTEPGTVTVWVRDRLGNLTESHISVSYDKPKGGGSGKGGKGGSGSNGNTSANPPGGERIPADEATLPNGGLPVEIPGIDETSALGNISLNAAGRALQAGRKGKRKSATGAEDTMRYGTIDKAEEPGFSEIVKALSGGDEQRFDSIGKSASTAASGKSGSGDMDGTTAKGGLKSGILASVASGARWVMRIIQKWKHVITYSLGGLIFFSLLGLGAVFFLVWKRKKRN